MKCGRTLAVFGTMHCYRTRQTVVVYARVWSAAVVERHTPPRTMLLSHYETEAWSETTCIPYNEGKLQCCRQIATILVSPPTLNMSLVQTKEPMRRFIDFID